MVEEELLQLTMNSYLLRFSFCWKDVQGGGVCTFVGTEQHLSKIVISHHCKV
jgi:hypothetical protein